MYISIDIETIGGPITPEMEASERAALAKEFKRESTIESHLDEWRQKAGVNLESSQPVAVGVVVFDLNRSDKFNPWRTEHEATIYGQDPYEITSNLASLLDEHSEGAGATKIIGYNIKAFDIPILLKYWPATIGSITPRNVIDLMFEPFGGRFDNRGGFKRLARVYGIKLSGVTGDKVGDMWAKDMQDGTSLVADYALDDARGVAKLYQHLSRFYSF